MKKFRLMAPDEIYQPISPSLLREKLDSIGVKQPCEVSIVVLGSGEMSKLTFVEHTP